jgi:GntR family transcriptional regulator/MocR family aminotransferase
MITVSLNADSKCPLYIQLYKEIKEQITEGRLTAGERLPSKRALSAHLKISVLTVENAYGQLCDEGYVYPKAGSGYYVERLLPRSPYAKKTAFQDPLPSKPLLPEKEILYDLSPSGTDTSAFPFSVWRRLSRETLSRPGKELLSPCPSAGSPELRCAIARYLSDFRGLSVDPAQIVVGAGSEYLLGLIIQLLGRDRSYGIENPGYHKISSIFKEQGVSFSSIELDEQGANPVQNKMPDVLHLTPSHHFPTGICMTAGRRHRILELVDAQGGYVIEDDYDSEFRYKGQVIPTLAATDQCGRVIYLSTFTKLLAPSMRISYMVLPPKLLEEYERRLSFYSSPVPLFEQLTLASFISGGHFEGHINRMKKIYKRKRRALLDALSASSLDAFTKVEGSEAGLHLLLKIQNGMSEETLLARAAKQGVLLHGLSEYRRETKSTQSPPIILLGYTTIPENDIEKAVKKLEKAWTV